MLVWKSSLNWMFFFFFITPVRNESLKSPAWALWPYNCLQRLSGAVIFAKSCHYSTEQFKASHIKILSCCRAFACFPIAVFLVSAVDYFWIIFWLWVCLWTVWGTRSNWTQFLVLVTGAWLLYNQHYMSRLKMQICEELEFGEGFVSKADDDFYHAVSVTFWD